MNISEVIDGGNYALFRRMGEANRTKHIDLISFIQNLSDITSIDISSWHILDTFGSGRGNNLVGRAEIKQRFFNRFREIQRDGADSFTLSDDVQRTLNESARIMIANRIANLTRERDKRSNDASSYMREAHNFIGQAFRKSQEIAALTNREIDIGAQISTLCAEGFWEFGEINHDAGHPILKLHTRNNIICHHRNDAAGINITCNLGRFTIEINVQDMCVLVKPRDGNTIVPEDRRRAGHYHPHVNSNGSLCWGNSSVAVTKWLAKGEIVEVIRLLAHLLSDYEPSNPWVTLNELHEVQQAQAAEAAEASAVPPTEETPLSAPPEEESPLARSIHELTETNPRSAESPFVDPGAPPGHGSPQRMADGSESGEPAAESGAPRVRIDGEMRYVATPATASWADPPAPAPTPTREYDDDDDDEEDS